MANRKQHRVVEEVGHRASEYLARELGVRALVTVTRTEMSPDLKRAFIFISVLPQSKEAEVKTAARRARNDFRNHMTKESKIRPVPIIDFLIDEGEKNRQRIDELMKKKNS